ncbi:hypothetical protein [Psychrobacillus lasiicapitis]|nr:hypothetical protein [Psychrobacillus lasiicapitis]GGA29309.1 hypothetical protein GCM10011384_18510 [Psychrobacillus lasiicapitis]
METVFRRIATEVKSYLHIEDILLTGPVCPFLSKLHIETSYRKLFVYLF